MASGSATSRSNACGKIPILRCMLEGAEVRRRARAGFSPYRRGPLSSTPSLARHALDADHVAAVAIPLSHCPNLRMSGIIGLWWCFGHTVVLFLAGIAIFVLKLRVPEGLSQAAEFGVGLLLVVLGGSLAGTHDPRTLACPRAPARWPAPPSLAQSPARPPEPTCRALGPVRLHAGPVAGSHGVDGDPGRILMRSSMPCAILPRPEARADAACPREAPEHEEGG